MDFRPIAWAFGVVASVDFDGATVAGRVASQSRFVYRPPIAPSQSALGTTASTGSASSRIALAATSVIASLAFAPVAYGYAVADGKYFTGSGAGVTDYAYYLSLVRQGADGRWLTTNLFTTDAQAPVFLHPSYVLIGHAARLLHVSPVAAYHGARLAFIVAFVQIAWHSVRTLLAQPFVQKLALMLICFSSGLSWIGFDDADYLRWPVDRWLGEATTFSTVTAAPHYALSLAIKTLAMTSYYRAIETRRLGAAGVTGLCCAWLAFDHPFDVVSTAAILAVFTAVAVATDWRLARRLAWSPTLVAPAVVAAIAAPAVFAVKWQVAHSAVLAARTARELEPIAPIRSVLLGLGLTGLLAIVGAVARERPATSADATAEFATPNARLFVTVWAIVNVGVMFANPTLWYARRLILGAHVAVAMLAAVGLTRLFDVARTGMPARRAIAALTVFALAITPLKQTLQLLDVYDEHRSGDHRLYLEQGEIAALRWIHANVPASAAVQALPWLAVDPTGVGGVSDATLPLF
ncbi:MAG: hypothetical protein ACHREM_29195, partial [Polyangiales bacterium]